MVIRGAPAIGVAAAMGVALGVLHSSAKSVDKLRAEFPQICDVIAKTRPTAVDLFWALERMKARFAELTAQSSDLHKIKQALVAEAQQVHLEKKASDEAIDRYGAEFMPRDGQMMTQCNAGALATSGIGTTLRVLRTAFDQGSKLHVCKLAHSVPAPVHASIVTHTRSIAPISSDRADAKPHQTQPLRSLASEMARAENRGKPFFGGAPHPAAYSQKCCRGDVGARF